MRIDRASKGLSDNQMNDHDTLQGLPDRPLLRIGEVAHFFSVSPKEIYEWCSSGMLAGRKHKGVLQISRDSVIDFIRKNEGRREGEREGFRERNGL